MNLNNESRVGRYSQRGQTLVLVPLMLLVLLSICALVIDMGNVYVCYQDLKSATNAAALAGGGAMSAANLTGIDPKTVAKQYSGSAANGAIYNLHPNLTIATVTPTVTCIQPSAYPGLLLPACATYYGPEGNVNVITVTETATVPTFFARLFGVNSVPISATATASAKGGGAPPYNIMLVLDTTASMGQGTDTGCLSTNTHLALSPEQCAQEGVQTLLTGLTPCASTLGTCGSATNGLTQNAVDEVGLMVFPGLTPTQTTTLSDTTAAPTANKDYNCPASNPSITPYNNNPGYLILPFQNDFRTSATASLNTGVNGSNLVKAVGAVTDGSCTGAQTPGGEGTFYAGVIIAAQDYLAANTRQGAKNVMILLSDGNATTDANIGGTTKQTVSLGGMNGSLFSATAACTQAVNAAAYAKAAGTLIYSISYGSETSGCTSGETPPYNTPCGTMQGISSLPLSQYFFSVPLTKNGTVSTVCSGAAPITQLSQVFQVIQSQLTTSRLIPNSVH